MPGLATTAEKHAIINARLRTATMYVGLLTAVADAPAGTVTEVSGNNYSRAVIAFDAPSAGSTQNSADINFATPSGSWGSIVGIGIYAAASGGSPLYIDNDFTPQTVGPLNPARIPAGQFIINVGDA